MTSEDRDKAKEDVEVKTKNQFRDKDLYGLQSFKCQRDLLLRSRGVLCEYGTQARA